MRNIIIRIVVISVFLLSSGIVQADQVILDDLIVDGSNCVGFDCVNGESFGFDTMRIKENNLRIHFDDTSNSASFPKNDWRITANDSSNGGLNKFSIDDVTGGRTPFTIEAAAPTNSLYVENSGEVGLGTNNPVVELHIVDGDTPTVRLEQNGSSGFTPQTWDLAGNETNFFLRDVTNGSTLPFRIRPGAPTSSIDVAADGDVGIGTSSPGANLHIRETSSPAQSLLQLECTSSTDADRDILKLTNSGGSRIVLEDTIDATTWKLTNVSDTFRITKSGTSKTELKLDASGNLTLAGTLTTGSTTVYPDYVFEDNYPLMSLTDLNEFIEKEGHLPNMTSAEEVEKEGGINITELQIKLLEKVEELTLYTLKQQTMIDNLKLEIQDLKQ